MSQYYEGTVNTSRLEINIAKLYIFFLPFRLFTQLSFLKGIVGVCANYMPFVFHILGFVVWMINEHGIIYFSNSISFSFLKKTTFLVIYLNLSSLIMAVVMQATLGNHGGESAFSGISGMAVYFAQYLMMFVYCARIFEILNREEINKILHRVCLLLLAIGYFQVLVMNGIGRGIYDAVNVFGILNASTRLPKLCLTGSEGATAGCIIAVFVIPFLLSKVLEVGEIKYIFEIIAWLIPLFFTYSSTAYILVAVDVLLFTLLLSTRRGMRSTFSTLISIIIILAIVVLILVQTGLLGDGVTDRINYLLFQKAADRTNGSTTSRTVPLLVNWGAFKEYPILGVGNGLQGYFYEKYFPSWALNVAGSDVGVFLEASKTGIANGGVFIPSLLSGYGVFGCMLIAVWIRDLVRNDKFRQSVNGNFSHMFLIASIAFIIMGFQGDAYGMYFAWFMLALPLYDGSRDDYTSN